MEDGRIEGRRVAILATDGVEQVELTEPRRALDEAGAETVLVSSEKGSITGWHQDDWGDHFDVQATTSEVEADDFDALLIPGGVMNPDSLRLDDQAVDLVRGFMKAGKPVASICHGPWMLVESDTVRSRTVTSWPSLRKDLENAGATWVDEEVVVSEGLVTSRRPADIDAFNAKMIEEIGEGVHSRRKAATA